MITSVMEKCVYRQRLDSGFSYRKNKHNLLILIYQNIKMISNNNNSTLRESENWL